MVDIGIVGLQWMNRHCVLKEHFKMASILNVSICHPLLNCRKKKVTCLMKKHLRTSQFLRTGIPIVNFLMASALTQVCRELLLKYGIYTLKNAQAWQKYPTDQNHTIYLSPPELKKNKKTFLFSFEANPMHTGFLTAILKNTFSTYKNRFA